MLAVHCMGILKEKKKMENHISMHGDQGMDRLQVFLDTRQVDKATTAWMQYNTHLFL